MSSLLALVAIVCFGFVAACEGPEQMSDKLEFSQFVGTYKASLGTAQLDQIEFRSDSTYVHFIQKQGGQMRTDSGRYRFIGGKNIVGEYYYYVDLSQFLIMDNEQICPGSSPQGNAGERLDVSCVIKRTGKIQSIVWCRYSYYYLRRI
jgi:hypothetical protein